MGYSLTIATPADAGETEARSPKSGKALGFRAGSVWSSRLISAGARHNPLSGVRTTRKVTLRAA